MKSALYVAYLLFAMLLMDLGLTAGMKLFAHPEGADPRFKSEFRVSSPSFHHTLKPLQTVPRAIWGNNEFTVVTNSLGFRDRDARDVPLQSDVYRVLVIGDSFTEGIGVNFEQTFVGRLQDRFRGDGIEFLNAGTVGYSPLLYWKKLEHYLVTLQLRVDEVWVFIDISDPSNELTYAVDENGSISVNQEEIRREQQEHAATEDGSSLHQALQLVREHTTLLRLFGKFIQTQIFKQPIVRSDLNLRLSMWTIDERLFDEYGRKGLEVGREHMDRLHDLVVTRLGLPLTVAVYPWPDQIMSRDLDSKQVSFWRDWAALRNVTLVDLFPAFISSQDPSDVLAKNFIQYDVHWNATGHELVAKRLEDYLVSLDRLQDRLKSKAS